MIKLKIDTKSFMREMNNIVGYANGFIDGVEAGKPEFFNNFAKATMEILNGYIDSNARIEPETLHHVYEWHQTGNPNARLFDIDYAVTGGGISLNATLRQSSSVRQGSNVPFYNKAKIMENGVPVTISPVNGRVLKFQDGGNDVFVSGSVNVPNPGGNEVEGSFKRIIDSFFNSYFTQAYLMQSGFGQILNSARDFNKNFAQASTGGRSLGFATGKQWIAKAGGLGVEFIAP
jgi:hypothetical protein